MHKAFIYQHPSLHIHSTQKLLADGWYRGPRHMRRDPAFGRCEVSTLLKGSVVPMSRSKFTRTPKMAELVAAGVPLRAVPTYHALADHARNKSGETFVSVARIAQTLRVCRRTVERHIGALEQAGVVKRQRQNRGKRGRWSSCLRILVSFARFAVRQKSNHGKRPPIFTGTRRSVTPSPHSPDRYRWLIGKEIQYHDQKISDEDGQLALFKPI